jgi:hypothetical protein
VLVAFLLLGLPLIVTSGRQYLGHSYDPEIPIWAFGWFPHAILHGENPFITPAIWTPDGANLTWATTEPGLALLFAPLTLAVGAIGSYNVAETLLPALAAWSGYLLCRYIARSLWPAVVGGVLFGFSPYLLAQTESGHAHMASAFLLPLVALVILRFLDRKVGRRLLVVELGVILAFQLLFSTEVAFTLTLAIMVSLTLAAVLVPARRGDLRALVAPLAGAYLLAGLLTAPFLYYAFSGFRSGFSFSDGPAVDLASLVIPTQRTLVLENWLDGVSDHISATAENGGYLGLPVVVMMALFAWKQFRSPQGRFLLAAVAVVLLLAVGGRLVVAGRLDVPMPWMLINNLPVFDNMLPSRLMAYLTLLAAVIVALWIAARPPGALRWLLPALAVLAIVPFPKPKDIVTSYYVSPFFTDNAFSRCLRPNETVLLIPQPEQILAQTLAAYRFKLAGGYLGPGAIPDDYLDKETYAISVGTFVPRRQIAKLGSFIAEKGVTSIIVEHWDYKHFWPTLNLLATPQHVGGVYLYRLAAGQGGGKRCR